MKINYQITLDLCRQLYVVSVDGEERFSTSQMIAAFRYVANDLKVEIGGANFIIRHEAEEFFHALELHERAHKAESDIAFLTSRRDNDIPPEQEPVAEIEDVDGLLNEIKEEKILTAKEKERYSEVC